MNTGDIGNLSAYHSRYSTEQQAQKQELSEQQAEQSVVVQQPARSQKAGAKPQSQTTAGSGASSVAEISGQIAETLENDDSEDSEQTLINKANSGIVLTQSELSRLKEADPALYSRVVKAEQAREELKNQMKNNPSGAKQALYSAIAQNSADGQEIVRKALSDEYGRFASKYDQVELSGASFGKRKPLESL